MKLELHTIRFGDPVWMRTLTPSVDSWCAENNVPITVWGDGEPIDPSYPAHKFCEVDMLKRFLAGDSDWFAYLDADIYIHQDTPYPPLDKWSGLVIRPDNLDMRTFSKWVSNNMGEEAVKAIPFGWKNRNAGSWFCDREAASQLLGVVSKPYKAGLQEQMHFNWWLLNAHANGMILMELPEIYNQWFHRKGTGCFHHLSGKRKAQHIATLSSYIDGGLEPASWSWSRAFPRDFAQMELRCPNMAADELHVDLLYNAVLLDSHRESGKKVVVEIGAYDGVSTQAFLHLIDEGVIEHLHIVELVVRPALSNRISKCRYPERVTLHVKPFWETKIDSPDFVFIDGDHGWSALADTLHALTTNASTIAHHDPSSYPRLNRCWGANKASNILAAHHGRQYLRDDVDREGMDTWRGLSVSVPSSVSLDPIKEFLTGVTYA